MVRDRGQEEVAHPGSMKGKCGFALKTLTPSQGFHYSHCEMIVPVGRGDDGLLTVAAAINLTQRTAFLFLSSGTCHLSLMTLIMVPTCW